MYENGKIYMGLADGQRVELALNMCNRHGLIAGASGTGKTITMKVMAESFSDAGVPVFLCDVKGDVAGICEPPSVASVIGSDVQLASRSAVMSSNFLSIIIRVIF